MTKISALKLFALLPLLALATGCASITRGSNDALVVNSTPDQADVKVYRLNAGFNTSEIKNNTVEDSENPGAGPLISKTPASFKLARKGEYKVVISKDGFKTTEVEIGNKVSTAGRTGQVGNVLFGGIVGVVVDQRTGATKDLTPNPVEVTLEEGEGTIVISLQDSKNSELNEELEEEAAQVEEAQANELSTEQLDNAAESTEAAVESAPSE